MKERLFFLLRTCIFWIILFVAAKIVFLIYEFHMTSQLEFQPCIASIWHGVSMDIAMSSYIILLFSVALAFTFFLTGKKLAIVFKIFNTILLSFFLLIIVIDLEIYRNWGFHLDTTPFQYLSTPEEAAASTPFSIYLLTLSMYGVSLFFSIRIYKCRIIKKLERARAVKFYFIPAFLLLAGCMVIPARGGLDVQPMNNSFVYYSKNIYANHIAVNPVWNFFYALNHIDNFGRDYDFLPKEEANKRFEAMMKDNGTSDRILKTSRPNVIIIIIESFSSDLLEFPDIVPNLKKCAEEGLFFSNYHSVAGRSDKGICATLSGYPAHPGDAVIKNTTKIENMPNIGRAFKDMGYYNSFYYGGNINFANMKSYSNISRFDRIISKPDFPSKYCGAKWGVHDEYTFKKYYDDLKDLPTPFFNVFFTLSSHEPFDVPDHVIKGNSIKNKFLNTALYTDKQLGIYMDRLRHSKFWDNALVIITADHGSRFINPYKETEIARYHIPMIWTGGALNRTGIVSKYGSQTDLISTLLHQMDYPCDEFIFSKDLLSPGVEGFSYFTYRGGCGFISKDIYQVYDTDSQFYLTNEGAKDTEMPGRVYLQTSYNYFLEK